MKKILRYLRPYYRRMTAGLSIKFVGSIMDLAIPWILAHILDSIIPLKDVSLILLWGGIMIACSVIAVLGNIIANRIAAGVARDCTREIRHNLFAKITRLSCAQIDRMTIPSLMSRLTSDTYNIHRMLGMMQRMGVRAPILLLGGVGITFTLEPTLTFVLLAVLPLITAVVFLVSRKGIPLFTALQRSVDYMVRKVRENASGIRVIKALSKTDYEKRRFDSINTEVMEKEKQAGITMAITNPMMNLLLNTGLTAVIIVGAYLVNAGVSQPGKIIAFLSYFTIILNAMMAVTRMFVMLSRGSASAGRIAQVLALPADLTLMAPDYIETEYHILFDKVSFSYAQASDKQNLTEISFCLKKGERLGIIGATGCGKSTVIQLLMRLYDADKGVIRIDGLHIRSIPPEKLHTMFGVAFQDDVLFADTISENIDFGRQLRQEQIRDAVLYAQADEFIDALEEGYDHRLSSRGTNLSGGQKQRLLIARALAAKPAILILDDSSSALDYRTDAKLRRALRQNFEDVTILIVAQRISSIMYADQILVMDEGRIVGHGNHASLLETCAIYQEISRSQMGGENHA